MSSMKEFKFGHKILKPYCKPFIVAEVGINHNGELKLAKKSIEEAAKAGADAVKFQAFHADEFMSTKNQIYKYKNSQGISVKENLYDIFKKTELPISWIKKLQTHAQKNNIQFLCSVADKKSVDLIAKLNPPAIKLSSEDLININLIKYVSSLDIPVILSTGMADKSEIDEALRLLERRNTARTLLLHCVSIYPTHDRDANLLRIKYLGDIYNRPVGYSDHTIGYEASVTAASLGAVLIEKHFTIDKNLPGPDHNMSSDPKELRVLIEKINKVSNQLGKYKITPSKKELKSREIFRRSIVASVNIPTGTILKEKMISLKRPGSGLHPRYIDEVTGKKTIIKINKNDQIKWEFLK